MIDAVAAPAAARRRCRPSTAGPASLRRGGARLKPKGNFDAVLIADGGQRMAARRRAKAVRRGAAAARHRIVGDRDRRLGRPRRCAAPGMRRRPTMFNQLRTRYRARYGKSPYRLASLGYDAVLLAVRIAKNWPVGRPFPARELATRRLRRGRRAFRFGSRRDRRALARSARGDRDRDVTVSPAPRASTRRRSRQGSSRAERPGGVARGSAPSRRQQAVGRSAVIATRFSSTALDAEPPAAPRGIDPSASRSPISSASMRRSSGQRALLGEPWPLRASAERNSRACGGARCACRAPAVRAGADPGIIA
jgi:hypothetical protein